MLYSWIDIDGLLKYAICSLIYKFIGAESDRMSGILTTNLHQLQLQMEFVLFQNLVVKIAEI